MRKLATFGGILLSAPVFLQHCGNPPPVVPAPYTGSIRILAMDTATIRSISIVLDDVNYGIHPNPYILEGVLIGTHKLYVADETNAGTSTTVEVFQDRRSEVAMWLLAEGPYVGRTAPKFSVRSIDDQVIDLQQLKGRVVLLAFFEHT